MLAKSLNELAMNHDNIALFGEIQIIDNTYMIKALNWRGGH